MILRRRFNYSPVIIVIRHWRMICKVGFSSSFFDALQWNTNVPLPKIARSAFIRYD
jgi:hypothetical protein